MKNNKFKKNSKYSKSLKLPNKELLPLFQGYQINQDPCVVVSLTQLEIGTKFLPNTLKTPKPLFSITQPDKKLNL